MGNEVSTYRVVYDDSVVLPLRDAAPITGQTKLARADVCEAVIGQYGKAMKPCGTVEGSALGFMLLGHYPAREVFDAKVYAQGIQSAFAEYPKDVGMEAIDAVTRRLKFLPTRAEVFEALEQMVTRRRALAHRAALHLAERLRRENDRAETEKRERERRELRETLGEAWGAWWSIPVIRRLLGGTPQEFAAGWTSAADRDAFVAQWGTQFVKSEEAPRP
jgi:hypothetical protein